MERLSQHPQMTIPELANALEITTRAVEKQIAKLRNTGRLRRVGPAKGGHWEVLEGDLYFRYEDKSAIDYVDKLSQVNKSIFNMGKERNPSGV